MSKSSIVFWLVFFPSLLLIFGSLYLSLFFRFGPGIEGTVWKNHVEVFTPIYLLWMAVFFIHGLYDLQTFRRYTTVIFGLLSAMTVNVLLAVLYFYFQPDLILTPRRFLLLNSVLVFGLTLTWLLLVKYLLKNKLNYPVYVFADPGQYQDLELAIRQHSFLGYRFAGWVDENSFKILKFSQESILIFPESLKLKSELLKKVYELRKLGTKFFTHKDFYEDLLRRVYLKEINEAWFLENIDYQQKRFYTFLKRSVDLLFGFLGFVAFLVSWPICALMIKLTSIGPVLFVQERVGKDGKVFKVYKYRTMSGGSTDTWTSVNDPRITSVGRFLRKSRMDEWPQFINLLAGNMSLVGPRPEQPHLVQRLAKEIPFYEERHLVKPGITGWAQINNVYAGSVEETQAKLQYDLYYIKHRSLPFDLEIILKTFYYIFSWQGR